MKKILRSALAILVVGAMAAALAACGPEPADVPVDNTPAAGEPVITAAPEVPQPAESTTPVVTAAPATEDPALAATAGTQPTEIVTTTEETTVSTPAETEKATEKTTEKTEKKTEKTEKKTEKTEKVTEATEEEPVEGSRLPDDEEDEDIELDWEDVNIDEWFDMVGGEGGGEDVPDIDVNE